LIFFSRAIACYICNRYAPDSELYPKDPVRRAKVDHVLYADTTFVEDMFKYTVSWFWRKLLYFHYYPRACRSWVYVVAKGSVQSFLQAQMANYCNYTGTELQKYIIFYKDR